MNNNTMDSQQWQLPAQYNDASDCLVQTPSKSKTYHLMCDKGLWKDTFFLGCDTTVCYLSIKLHGINTQMKAIFTVTTVRTSIPTKGHTHWESVTMQ